MPLKQLPNISLLYCGCCWACPRDALQYLNSLLIMAQAKTEAPISIQLFIGPRSMIHLYSTIFVFFTNLGLFPFIASQYLARFALRYLPLWLITAVGNYASYWPKSEWQKKSREILRCSISFWARYEWNYSHFRFDRIRGHVSQPKLALAFCYYTIRQMYHEFIACSLLVQTLKA